MKRFVVMLSFAIISSNGYAQLTYMKKELAKDTIQSSIGPNRKKFSHFFIGFAIPFGQPDSAGATVKNLSSGATILGFQYKRRFTNFLGAGFQLAYRSEYFRLKQDSNKILPNSIQHKKEKLTFGQVQAGLYIRINYGKRGDRVGNYIDLGGYSSYIVSSTHYTRDVFPIANASGATISEVHNHRLVFIEPLQYGLEARVGFNRYAFWATYRLSNIFNSKYIFPEMPRICAGIQIALYK